MEAGRQGCCRGLSIVFSSIRVFQKMILISNKYNLMAQWSRIESLEVGPPIYRYLVYDNDQN